MSTINKAIFLDRDGTINNVVDRGQNFSVAGKEVRYTAPFSLNEFQLKDRVTDILMSMKQQGYILILVTNQPDVTYKTLSQDEHEKIMERVAMLPFDDIYVCTHGRDDGCSCKKPKTGMFEEAKQKWSIDVKSSFVIGDSSSDISAAHSLGATSIILDAPYNKNVDADHRIAYLEEALEITKV